MKLLQSAAFLSVAVVATTGAAFAKPPYFAAKCPTDITVETDRAGRAYVNGKKATVRSKNADYSEIVGGGVTISVARDAGSLIVTYTGPHRAHGTCEITEQETIDSAAPQPATPSAAKPYDDVPKRDKQACLKAVKKTTHNPKLTVLGGVSSEANNTVTIGVGADKAPWRCLVKNGKVADVMSQTNEGGL
jgi:hypothetical protein